MAYIQLGRRGRGPGRHGGAYTVHGASLCVSFCSSQTLVVRVLLWVHASVVCSHFPTVSFCLLFAQRARAFKASTLIFSLPWLSDYLCQCSHDATDSQRMLQCVLQYVLQCVLLYVLTTPRMYKGYTNTTAVSSIARRVDFLF